MYTGLLWREERTGKEADRKAMFADFNLDVCISKMNSLIKGYDLYEYYHALPEKPETTEYRRMVTGDMRNPILRADFSRYAVAIEKAKKQEKNSSYSQSAERMKWHADALFTYSSAVEKLHEKLKQAENLSPALAELVQYLEDYLNTAEYQEWRQVVEQVQDLFDSCPIHFVVQKNKVVVEEEQEKEPFEKRIMRAFRIPSVKEDSWEEFRPLTVFEARVSERLIHSLGQKKPMSFLLKIKMDETLIQVADEVQFYLGFFEFYQFMEEKGYCFSLPEPGGRFWVEEGYDAAMAVQSDKPVISNDFEIHDGEHFFVITGANGGGKTTFARMIGQILYFSRMGLMVPCRHAVLPQFADILTHFSDEESEKTGRGKLMEELCRLKPMMEKAQENTFVVLNELFTTAATLDAGIMGKRVLTYFRKKKCFGIYVTHIQSLAEEGDGIVSMVAELQEDHHTRSYKIARKPASEGEYEDSLITKHHMTYDQMKDVMEHGG